MFATYITGMRLSFKMSQFIFGQFNGLAKIMLADIAGKLAVNGVNIVMTFQVGFPSVCFMADLTFIRPLSNMNSCG